MKLGDYLAPTSVLAELEATTKAEVLAEMVAPLATEHPELDPETAARVLMERERLGTTGIGDGIAIPHGKLPGLGDILLAVGRSVKGVSFDALDNEPCRIFFMVLAPVDAAGQHLRLLAHISRLLKSQDFRAALLAAPDQGALWRLLADA
ncbi:putative PTS IIA-like nitrogen-regulatory protein PtsN [Alkalidesulfovibrio alkalitolerans DSM 16529]|uniref:Putative PTS IIA-like nitrogen-regulatory protein PtsN n=1 Tax=Alkalidesulfovibrio alkalitolerans DSM 16529 TaxID=1121439 RepID=S7T2G1_9BACT|nr:PTS sugar transporter subunit IIA [Alkalidesulfovibrio alkalitolerans]EPR30700.1 putative PTS IIA-like nitrogen-regulatory protein PtsN [Alkalidesulfovibrio alkalitolerans DSM 16529]